MIIESTALSLGACGFIIIAFIGALISGIGSIGKSLFGGSKAKTSPPSSTVNYDRMLQQQAQAQRDFEQRMLLQLEAQKKSGINPMVIIAGGGIAVAGLVFMTQMMGRR